VAAVLFFMLRFFSASAMTPDPEIAELIAKNAERRHLDPLLVATIVAHESHFDPRAEGTHHDYGLMQIVRGGAATRGLHLTREQLFNPEINLYLGVWYLADRIRECGSLAAGVGGYNARACGVNAYARRALRDYRRAKTLTPTRNHTTRS
jgi:soluble lytic murein transglycosylase-like protein